MQFSSLPQSGMFVEATLFRMCAVASPFFTHFFHLLTVVSDSSGFSRVQRKERGHVVREICTQLSLWTRQMLDTDSCLGDFVHCLRHQPCVPLVVHPCRRLHLHFGWLLTLSPRFFSVYLHTDFSAVVQFFQNECILKHAEASVLKII